tara:strand:- start:170 stop:985 length:816 start_codon:yes stop_codon:yes gene_type:complete
MLGVPLMIMGAAKQAVAKKIDKRARKDLREAMGNVAGAMGGGGSMAFRMKSDPLKISNGSDKKQLGAFRTRILAQQEKKKQKEKFSNKEQMPTAPSKPVKRVKSDLPDNSPNALEIGLKKAKEEREAAEESAMERKKDKGVKFTPKTGPNAGEQVIFRMKGMPPILREPTEKQKANLPPNLVKAIEDAPPMSRYNSETMEMENLKPLNRAALGMTGRNGDSMGISRMHSSFPKRSAAGKAKLMKTRYGQTGKAIPTNQLIKPIFKKAKGKE